MSGILNRLGFSKDELDELALTEESLQEILDDYAKYRDQIRPTASPIADTLQQIPAVHSTKYRLKSEDHLLMKVLRKRRENPSRVIERSNYRAEITDLIGVRALHLFKEDWVAIHDFLLSNWELVESPVANVRVGVQAWIEMFQSHQCDYKDHPKAYRSVHYLVKSQPAKAVQIAEIQVRTIFEEGWSEIDHRVRYPLTDSPPVLNQFLHLFNRLSGAADEMGSFVNRLRNTIDEMRQQHEEQLQEKEKAIAKLKKEIKDQKLASNSRQIIEEQIEKITACIAKLV